MANFIFKKSIDRRFFLKGSGAAVALPFLSSMVPAFGKNTEGNSPRRFMAINAGLGYHSPYFFPKKAGKSYKLSPYLNYLKDYRNKFTVFSGVSHKEQNGNNGHASGMTLLTSAKRPGLAGFKNTISIDQLIAAKIGAATRYTYLSTGTAGSGLSWSANGVQIPSDNSPLRLFKKLLINGSKEEVKAQMKELIRGKSVLDAITAPAKDLDKKLGPKDKEKLDEYLTSIRELEIRLQQNQNWVNKPKPKVNLVVKNDPDKLDVVGKLDLYYHILALALQTDSSRSITFNIGGSGQVPKINGVTIDWHNLSHHGKDEAKIKELALIENQVFLCFNRFLKRLDSIQEGGQKLLDSTVILKTSNLGNAASHNWRNLPVLVVGGNFKHGSHISFDEKNNEPMANLLCQLGNYMSLGIDKFGFSEASSIKGFES